MSEKTVLAKLLWILTLFLLASVHLAEAQQAGKVPRIGFVPVSGDPSAPGLLVEAFQQGLRDLGYIEGKNIEVEYRWPLGRLDHIPAVIAELVQLNVDVLVVVPQPGINAAKKNTKKSLL